MDLKIKNKKRLVLGVLLLVTLFSFAVVGAVGFVIKKGSELASRSPGITLPNVGFAQATVQNLASGWVQQQLLSQEAISLKAALHCFDAIGGPSPKEMIEYVKKQVANETALKKLDSLSTYLAENPSTPAGPASCAAWLLNS